MSNIKEYPDVVNERAGEGFKRLYHRVKDERDRAQDLIVPASALRMRSDGTFTITGGEQADDGVANLLEALNMEVAGGDDDGPVYVAMPHAHRNVAGKIKSLNWSYYDRMLREDPALCATNINRWFNADSEERNYLVRALKPEGGVGPHTLRAVLSDSYFIVPNYDVTMMTLATLQNLNVRVDPLRSDITEERMYLSFQLPEVFIDGTPLLKGYRNPRTGDGDYRIHAGFTIRNSEIGQAKFEVVPRPFAKCCLNCFTLKEDALSRVHLGSKMNVGEVTWSRETMNKLNELIVLQVRDAVERFCSVDYLNALAGRIEGLTGKKLEHPEKAVRNIARFAQMDDATADKMVEDFINGGLHTAMGALQAFTFRAQEADSPDDVYAYEDATGSVIDRLLKGVFDVDRILN